MNLVETLTTLVPKKLRGPRDRKRLVLWNLLFLVWAGLLLAVGTNLTFLGDTLASGGSVRVTSREAQPDSDPLETEFEPLEVPVWEDAEFAETGSAVLLNSDAEDAAWPKPRMIPGGYLNPIGRDTGKRLGSLGWLSAHQNEDGYWSASGFAWNSGREGAFATHTSDRDSYGDPATDAGAVGADLAVTSLAMLTYLGAGYDHREGEFRPALRSAIRWMRAHQGPDGWPGARGVRDHALATIALCEAYGLSGDGAVKPFAESAVNQLIKLQLSYSGWGENSWGTADIVSTCYAVTAIKTAKMCGLQVNWEAAGLQQFLDNLCGAGWEVSYSDSQRLPPNQHARGFQRGPVCAAAWIVCALFSGYCESDDPRIRACANLLVLEEHLPKWERGRVDMEYWWFATQAIYQTGGYYMPSGNKRWDRWEKALTTALLENQRGYSDFDKERDQASDAELDEHGSWDAIDVWNTDGRVSTTALAALCLEIYYRYLRLEDR